MDNILVVDNLCKKYGNFELKNINISVPRGSIVGFIGENGAGKTTTIKSILNLINIDSGSIKVFDKDYIQFESEIKKSIGVSLDNSFFYEQLTPADINKILRIMYDNWDENLFYEYLDRFNLPRDKKLKDYSSGMLMKLKIFTALSHKPEFLILDEPTSGLDPIARSEILDIFQEFVQDKNHSIFFSSHITTDLEHVADYIIFINNGQIILNEKTDKLLDTYGVVKCDEKEFSKYDKKDYVKYKRSRSNYLILVDDKNKFKRKYHADSIDNATLDDIMLLYVRGE